MAGLYIHIPFCKTRCIYCGFYSTTQHEWQDRYVAALIKELQRRSGYLRGESIATIYLGGGTPSQLSCRNLSLLLDHALSLADKNIRPEVTMECNPDDVTPELATLLYNIGVNRVSMGIQTFSDDRLLFLRRRHTAQQARKAVETLRHAGIGNISVDLMFGFPDETLKQWETDIDEALRLDVEHISAYSLMYEEGTPLFRQLEEGAIKETDEETSRAMYYLLIDRLEAAGYEHYEISNFARPGFRSRHNSSYWNETPYLGIGAAAHSFDGRSRQWNVSNLERYVTATEQDIPCFEREEIDGLTRYNDIITTALRTSNGIDISRCGFPEYLLENARPMIENGLLQAMPDGRLRLTRKGLYVSDDIMAELIKI